MNRISRTPRRLQGRPGFSPGPRQFAGSQQTGKAFLKSLVRAYADQVRFHEPMQTAGSARQDEIRPIKAVFVDGAALIGSRSF